MYKENPEFFLCFARYLGQMWIDFSSQYIILEFLNLNLYTPKIDLQYMSLWDEVSGQGSLPKRSPTRSEVYKKSARPETTLLDMSVLHVPLLCTHTVPEPTYAPLKGEMDQ